MGRFLTRQLLLAIVVAVNVSLIGFAMLRVSGDLAQRIVGPEATAAQVETVRKSYGLDKPLVVQYADWAGAALRGDFGRSFFYNAQVSDLIAERLPVTMTLGFIGLLLALIVAIPLGILAAVHAGSWLDRLALTGAVLGQAMPSFWIGLLLILLFGLQLGWLPVSGTDDWKGYVMPSIVLGLYAAPALMRLTRSGMIDVLRSDYIRTARAKGLLPATVVLKHGLRNALIPVVSIAAVQLGLLMGGSVVVESVFSIHGLGYLAWESISRADFPVVQSIVLTLALMYVGLVFLSDVLNALLDPRLR
ncbi:Glutathione transport system permease protein GsiC [Hyphomicrobiales bacterium]|nr:Glutathione transport system permease protein GsiC [Hyphomicrobiales bacterium]CAH1697819.1 Glutathione transport system permease protein GsiC [Hyphomicrobiales bacterium]CAI0347465.1 Glutathione transport system permease protein GsiC [Hyphomicrobiales bacterium]